MSAGHHLDKRGIVGGSTNITIQALKVMFRNVRVTPVPTVMRGFPFGNPINCTVLPPPSMVTSVGLVALLSTSPSALRSFEELNSTSSFPCCN
jgi:hypothetical protein